MAGMASGIAVASSTMALRLAQKTATNAKLMPSRNHGACCRVLPIQSVPDRQWLRSKSICLTIRASCCVSSRRLSTRRCRNQATLRAIRPAFARMAVSTHMVQHGPFWHWLAWAKPQKRGVCSRSSVRSTMDAIRTSIASSHM